MAHGLTERGVNAQQCKMLAAIWVVAKNLDAGFHRRICPSMLVRANFAVTGFKSLPNVCTGPGVT